MAVLPSKVAPDTIQQFYNNAEQIAQLSYEQGLALGKKLKKQCEDTDDDVMLIELLGQIGASWILEILKSYLKSEDDEIKHAAIFALLEYSRANGIPTLIKNFENEENEELREDTRVVLIGLLGKDTGVLFNFADPQGEYKRINEYWNSHKNKYIENLCYTRGELVNLKIWIDKLENSSQSLKEMLNNRLFIWTGQKFSINNDLTSNWNHWWNENSQFYENGKRYFMSYLIE